MLSIFFVSSEPTSLRYYPPNLCRGLPKGLFPSDLPTKTLYAFLDSSTRATCPTHLSRLDLTFLIMLTNTVLTAQHYETFSIHL